MNNLEIARRIDESHEALALHQYLAGNTQPIPRDLIVQQRRTAEMSVAELLEEYGELE